MPRFFRLSVLAVVGGGGRGQDWSEHNNNKNVALTQRGKDGKRGARAADIPLVVLDGFRFAECGQPPERVFKYHNSIH